MIRGPIAGALFACLLVGVLAVSVAAVGGVTTGPMEAGEQADVGGIGSLQEEIAPDDVLLAIEVTDEGDAVWTIEYRTRLDTEDDEAAFEDLRADIEADPDAYTAEFDDRMTATADSAANATGREMSISNMTVHAERRELPREYGVVTYAFEWSNFAAVDGDRMVVGDAIDGLFLDDASELRISWAVDRALVEATPSPTETRSTAVVWRGPTTFDEGEPRVVLDPASETDPGGTDGDSAEGPSSDGVVSATSLAVLLIVLVVVSSAYAVRRGWVPRVQPDGTIGADPAVSGSDGARDGDGPISGDSAAEDDVATAGDSGESGDETGEETDADVGAADESDGGADPDSGSQPIGGDVDPELLSNEEQVLRLIEANGGRMKQKRVGEELDWTAAKTSQVTKRLREDGDLEGFRLGRENVLTLPDEDPR